MSETEQVEAPGLSVGEIKGQARRGLRWGIVGNLVMRLGSFCVGLVLARLLAPSEFGIYSLALAAGMFLMYINDIGIFAATVQWRGDPKEMHSTGAILAFVFSLVIYLGCLVAAPLYMAGVPGSEGVGVVRLVTLVIVVDGITCIRAATLVRTFRQDKLIIANLVGFVVQAAVTVPMAVAGYKAYSFAWGFLIGNIVTGALVLWFAAIPFSVRYDKVIAKRLMSFGVPLAISLLMEAILGNADKSIVSSIAGATVVGYYGLAFNVASWMPGLIGQAVRYVTLPGFSRLAENDASAAEDRASLARGVQQSIPLLFAAVLPVALCLVVLGTPLVTVLYGDKWGPSGIVLSFLAFYTIAKMITPLVFDILTSQGATKATVVVDGIWCAALIPGLIIGTHLNGATGAAAAQAIAGLVALPAGWYALSRNGIPIGPMFPRMVRPLVAGGVAMVVMLALSVVTHHIAVLQLIVVGFAGMATYALVLIPGGQFTALLRKVIPARS